jgi:hypothetical protein
MVDRRTVHMDSVLQTWLKLVSIENCVDIGGGGGTAWLARNLPHVPHYLVDIKPESGEVARYRENGTEAFYCTADVSKGVDKMGLYTLDNYLLKIDIDGPEIDMIANSPETMTNAVMVICEATTWTISARMAAVEATGKKLMEIANPCFYCQRLWQVDLVFVREDLIPDWIFTPAIACDLSRFQDGDVPQ